MQHTPSSSSQKNNLSSIVDKAKSITNKITQKLNPQVANYNPQYMPHYNIPSLPKPKFKLIKWLIYGTFIITILFILISLREPLAPFWSRLNKELNDQIYGLITAIQENFLPYQEPVKNKKITKQELLKYDRNNDGKFDQRDWDLLDIKDRQELLQKGYKPKNK